MLQLRSNMFASRSRAIFAATPLYLLSFNISTYNASNAAESLVETKTQELFDPGADAGGDTKPSPCSLVSAFATKGQRPGMEDFFTISSNKRFFAIFDGHGGRQVSEYCEMKAIPYLNAFLKENSGEVTESIRQTFEQITEEVLETGDFDLQGSCAVSIYLTDKYIVAANIGDSRAILCRGGRSFDLTIDHKPNLPSEVERIEKLGGKVEWDGYLGPDRQPVPGMGAWRVNETLAVSRAIGDRLDLPFISSEPDIMKLERKPTEDTFIVLASDGLWDVISSEECVMFVSQVLQGSVGALEDNDESIRRPMTSLNQWMNIYKNDRNMVRAVMDSRKSKMAQFLTEESLRRGSEDNITVIVIWLKS